MDMNIINSIYDVCDNKNINVFAFPIPNYKATTIELNGNYGIFIDYKKIEDLEDEFLVLCHEYGHCTTGTTHKLNSPYELIEKHEYQANKKSVYTFLPFNKIKNAAKNGCHTVYELSTYLDFPEYFVKLALKIYECCEPDFFELKSTANG